MTFPRQIRDLIEAFERLPGVGPKTAERLAFYLLNVPESELNRFATALTGLKKDIRYCSVCKNITDQDICDVCSDKTRDQNIICVVESPLDVFSLEKTDKYKGVYHVLHGLINPLANIGPDEIFIDDLLKRLVKPLAAFRGSASNGLREVILALNPTMEGEATAMYLRNKIQEISNKIKITRLGVGLPIGGDMQYADETTLTRALEGRRDY